MSTGLPFNSTFDFFENEHELNGIDPLDHNGNTSPQRTARDDTQKYARSYVNAMKNQIQN